MWAWEPALRIDLAALSWVQLFGLVLGFVVSGVMMGAIACRALLVRVPWGNSIRRCLLHFSSLMWLGMLCGGYILLCAYLMFVGVRKPLTAPNGVE